MSFENIMEFNLTVACYFSFFAGFSLSRYLENSGYGVADSLPIDISDRLLSYLGMDTLFLKPDCLNAISPYSVTNMTEDSGILKF